MAKGSQAEDNAESAETGSWCPPVNSQIERPWVVHTAHELLDPEKEYYCLYLYGRVPFHTMWFGGFLTQASRVFQQLENMPPGCVVGSSTGISPFTPSPSAEAVAVFHDRKYVSEFVHHGAHKEAMQKLGPLNLKFRRIWVKAHDIPDGGNSCSTSAFYQRIKRGDFKEATDLSQR